MARSVHNYPSIDALESQLEGDGVDPLCSDSLQHILQSERILWRWAEDPDSTSWSRRDLELEHVRIHRLGLEYGLDPSHDHGDFMRELDA